MRGVSLADVAPSVWVASHRIILANSIQIEWKALFHVREELKSYRERVAGDSQDTCRKHLDVLVDYTETTYKSTVEHLSVLLGTQEITYNLLWALFNPNTEVYTTCPGTGASRCVLYNHCEEKAELDGSKYMHIEGRYLNSDGQALGEATAGVNVPIFRGSKRIQHLRAYPLRYHPEKERVRRKLVQCGRHFVSLMGTHHRKVGTTLPWSSICREKSHGHRCDSGSYRDPRHDGFNLQVRNRTGTRMSIATVWVAHVTSPFWRPVASTAEVRQCRKGRIYWP